MKAFLELSAPAQYFLFLVFIFVPATGVIGYFRIRSGKPLRPKRQRYRVIITVQFFILLITLSVARERSIELLGREWGNPWVWTFVVAYLVTLAARLRRVWVGLSAERLEKAGRLLPDDPSLMRLWVGLAAMAGISEECAYRGLAFRLLMQMGASIELALLLCVVTFAIGHMAQGWRGVLATLVLAVLFHGIVIMGNSLYPAIVFHAVYNLIVGVIAMPILSNFAKTQALTAEA